MKPEELVEGEFIDMNEESVCDRKHEGILEEMILAKKLHVKENIGATPQNCKCKG